MSVRRTISAHVLAIKNLFAFLIERRAWLMIPLLAILVVFFLILMIGTATPAGPFIYTIF